MTFPWDPNIIESIINETGNRVGKSQLSELISKGYRVAIDLNQVIEILTTNGTQIHLGSIRDLMTHCLHIGDYIHDLYETDGIVQQYNDWTRGPDPNIGQTQGCVLIERIHNDHKIKMFFCSPLGRWGINIIEGNDDTVFQKIIRDLGCVMVGEYWLVTEFNGQPIPHPVINVLVSGEKNEISQTLNHFSAQKYIHADLATKIFDAYIRPSLNQFS